jgi:acylphosphatase
MDQTAKRIIFSGQVQGVGFRFTAQRVANRHQLTGFVRNLPDGSVEVLTQGKPEDINKCIYEIKLAFAGCVRQTQIEDKPLNPKYTDFRITL